LIYKIILYLLFFTLTLYANHVRWHSDFDEAHKLALKQNKMLLVLLIKKDCLTCKDTIKTSFMNQKYIDTINEKYISVLIIKDQKSSYPIEMLYTFTYPSLFFLDENELFIHEPLRGDITPEKLKLIMQ
jgi:thioredoxin-related protein